MGAALVTGASSGIGLAIALGLAQSGRKVFAIARGTRGLNALRTAHAAITPIALDVTDREAVEATLDGLEIDVLVNNAGMMPPLGNFADMAMADIDTALEVNLSAAIALTRLVVPQMRARGRGDILFTGSTAGHGAYPNMAVYAATKGGIASFAQGLRADLSPFGIRVTEIVPGRVETGLYKHILDEPARAAMYASKAVQPEDVARMVRAVLELPEWATVPRFDIVPTHPSPAAKG